MTHPIVSEEIVKRAVQAYDLARRPRTATAQWYPLHAALEAVLPEYREQVLKPVVDLLDEWRADDRIFSPDSRFTMDVCIRELGQALVGESS